MRIGRIVVGLLALGLAACAPALPPNRMQVVNLPGLAGTYSGTMNEASELDRAVTFVLRPDGTFELVASDPKGFRTIGSVGLLPDGTLSYQYNEMKGRGQVATGWGAVYEGDGRRAIVLTQSDNSTTTTVSRPLP